jgi:glycogen operon protein
MSWVDWRLFQGNHEIFRFARSVFELRRTHPVFRREAFYTSEEIKWFNPSGTGPDWFDPRHKCLACWIAAQDGQGLYLMFNADTKPIKFVLPASGRRPWRRAVDTAQPSPRDICSPGEEAVLGRVSRYVVKSRSSVVLLAG